jgi:hypothetical protein
MKREGRKYNSESTLVKPYTAGKEVKESNYTHLDGPHRCVVSFSQFLLKVGKAICVCVDSIL